MSTENVYNRTTNLVPLPPRDAATPWPARDSGDWPIGPLPATADIAKLDEILKKIDSYGRDSEWGATFALLVSHRGKLVLEHYGPAAERRTWFGEMWTDHWPKQEFDKDTKFVSWSQAKSFVHACFGILLEKGLLESIDIPAHRYIAAWQSASDPRRAITIRHLLQMRAGLKWEESYLAPKEHPWPAVLEMIWGTEKHDAAGYAAAFPLEHEPGSKFYYASGTTNILVEILYDIIGLPRNMNSSERQSKFTAWIQQNLFDPLGIKDPVLNFDGKGLWFGSSYVYIRSREFLKFGELYLRDGEFDGNRVFPKGWADEARRLQSTIPRDEPFSDFEYGQQFWVCRDEEYGGFAARGYQGQITYVLPGLDMVIVRNGETPMERMEDLTRGLLFGVKDAIAGK